MSRKRLLFTYPFLLAMTWIITWLIYLRLDAWYHWTSFEKFLFWTVAKIIFWILPIVGLIQYLERRSLAEALQLQRFRQGAIGGLWAGGVIILLSLLFQPQRLLQGHFFIDWSLIAGAFIAPVVEEFVFRGYVLQGLLRNGMAFWRANVLTALFFLLIHLPGWYFLGTLDGSKIQHGISIVLLGLVFGWITRRIASLYAGMTAHVVNNLFSSFF